jgi:hypothetical protein
MRENGQNLAETISDEIYRKTISTDSSRLNSHYWAKNLNLIINSEWKSVDQFRSVEGKLLIKFIMSKKIYRRAVTDFFLMSSVLRLRNKSFRPQCGPNFSSFLLRSSRFSLDYTRKISSETLSSSGPLSLYFFCHTKYEKLPSSALLEFLAS